ncbi:TolB family protein [Candidatus Latescibacterota bacterium]
MKSGLLVIMLAICVSCARIPSLGEFENSTDVGSVQLSGSAEYDADTREYRITGSGENMWGTADGFQYVWRKVSGDVVLSADISWVGEGKNAHRKAGWVIRQGLEADDAYADAVVHGDGLTSLQYRGEKGGETLEVQSPISAPASIKLERHGDLFTLSVARTGEDFHPVGSVTVDLTDSVYVGLAVCSHDSTVSETAVFSNVGIENPGVFADDDRVLESTLEIMSIETGERKIVYRNRQHFEAPNWSRDGKSLIYNSGGLLYTIPAEGGTPERIDTGKAMRCNNDHGMSPDGEMLVISDQTGGPSRIYTLPDSGGEPRLVTELGPSYWHGWSPDGKTLAYCAERNGEYDIYTIPVEGGAEKRLTDAAGLDDGPDYSPDGKYIYFNSVRTGMMKIWRMNAEGGNEEQLTTGAEYNDWFAHPSPDGTRLVFVSFDKNVEGHPANKNVALRMTTATGDDPRVVARLFGGQGTINVPSWSPDSKQFAFVSYRLVGQ